jgi:hypothetical protein
MTLGSTQPLTEVVPGIFLGYKGGRCLGLTTISNFCTNCVEIWEPKLPGTLRACPDLYRDFFTFTISKIVKAKPAVGAFLQHYSLMAYCTLDP